MLGLIPVIPSGLCFWHFPRSSSLIAGAWCLYWCYRTKCVKIFGKKRTLPKLTYHVMHEGKKENDRVLWFFHGFPDNKEIFENQYAHFGAELGYQCVAVDMPLYAQKQEEFDPFGYSFEEVAAMIKACVEDFRAKSPNGKKKMTFVTFDWGCVVGATCEKLFREEGHTFIDSTFCVDVGGQGSFTFFEPLPKTNFKFLLWGLNMGLQFQWFHIFCFHLSLLGRLCGPLSGMAEKLVYNFQHALFFGPAMPHQVRKLKEEQARGHDKPFAFAPPGANYFYFHFTINMLMEGFGLRSAPVEVPRNETEDDMIPTFFIYGADKGHLRYHDPEWCKGLLRKNEKSRVVGLRSDWSGVEPQQPVDEIKWTACNEVGHYPMVTLPRAFNAEMEAWLKTL